MFARTSSLIRCGCALLSCSALLSAQTLLSQCELPGPLGSVGDRVAVAGDVNADGVNDLLVAGKIGVITYSGVDGSTKLGFQPIALVDQNDAVLNLAGLGDVDGDGQPDLLVATQAAGARAYSRASGAVLWTVPGSLGGSIGWRLAVLDDLDGDGARDVALGEPDGDPAGIASAGIIHVVSGATGAALHLINGTFDHQQLGRSLAAFSDFDGNGKQDLIVGDTYYQVAGTTLGRVLVMSALDGAVLLQIVNTVQTFQFAIEVTDAGDLDADGVDDLAAVDFFNSTSVLRVETWSGATAAPIWSRTVNQSFNLRSVGDANGDGAPELVVASPGYLSLPGSGTLLDGATGTALAPLPGSTPGSFLSIASPGDLTGDGLPELLVGNATSAFNGTAASAIVRSMPGGSVVYTILNPPGNTGLGRATDMAGDFDADGQPDVVLLSTTDLAVFSRSSGALLKQIPISSVGALASVPSAVAGPGDLNRDGVPDLVMGDPYFDSLASSAGRVLIYSGSDGGILGGGNGATSGEGFGAALEDTTDHDNDGVRDIYVSAYNKQVGPVFGAGEVQLRSGATFAVLATYHGLIQDQGRFGSSLSAGGDLNGDGVPELAVGSMDEQPAQLNAGTLYVLDGVGGLPLMTISGALNSALVSGAIVGDANGDEVPDVLAVESQWQKPGEGTARGRVRLFSGANAALLWEKEGTEATAQFGLRYGAAGDVDGDGYADVMASSTLTGLGSTVGVYSGLNGSALDVIDLLPDSASSAGALLSVGRVDAGACDDVLLGITTLDGNGGARVVASSKDGVHGFTDLGHAKATGAGTLPTLHGYGNLAPNQPVSIRVRHAPPLKSGTWFVGLGAANLPFKQGVLVPSPFGPFFVFGIASNAQGEFTLTAPNPPSVFTGLSLYHQFWFADPTVSAGVAATNGMQETFK